MDAMAKDLAPDWILQQALAIQETAHRSFVRERPELRADDGGLTITALGCGTMGIAILGGLMQSLQRQDQGQDQTPISRSLTTAAVSTPPRLPSKFNACVRRPETAEKVRQELGKYDTNLSILQNDNVSAVNEADVVLLCCDSHSAQAILSAEGMKRALTGKLLISILAGITERQIYDWVYSATHAAEEVTKCQIVRAVPNAAAAVRESMTVIGISDTPLRPEEDDLVIWIFTCVGEVVRLPSSNMDACTALCGGGTAFCSLMVESLAAGAIAMGVPREVAYTMAAQTMRGTTGLLSQGEHPAVLRDKVTTPGGATVHGLSVLEEGGVRGTVAKAVREATLVARTPGSR